MRLVATGGNCYQGDHLLDSQALVHMSVGSTVSVDVPEQANGHIRQRSPI
jgi:hypothetical protein